MACGWLALPAAGLLERCRVPPRRAGNFHLLAQMKVTKAKGLNAKPFIFTVAVGTAVRRALLEAKSTPPPARRGDPPRCASARCLATPRRRHALPLPRAGEG